MPFINVLIPVSVVWAIAAITPGPNFFITVHTAIGETRRLSLFTVSGVVFGTLLWSISGFLGVSLLFNAVPALYYSLKIIGGFYLAYIGIILLFTKNNNKFVQNSRNSLTPFGCFKLGLYTNILNPKTAAFMTSLFAATIPAKASYELGMLCVLLICTISALWYSFVATLFSHNKAKKAYHNFKTKIERISGAVFILFGIKLAISK
jgi:threonine/homoserine/homoserine lactone efflux protein